MNASTVLSQLGGLGQGSATSPSQGGGSALSNLAGGLTGGLAGGAAAGGLMALLMGNKKARKFAGKAATVGGAAVVGGLAFKAYQNWQAGQAAQATSAPRAPTESSFTAAAEGSAAPGFQWTLVKAMVAVAKVDGHLDRDEQKRIFDAVEEMNMSPEAKGEVFDLLGKDITIEELVAGVETIEQKSELYLASRLAVDPDHPAEQAHLRQLASLLGLPDDFVSQLDAQVAQAA